MVLWFAEVTLEAFPSFGDLASMSRHCRGMGSMSTSNIAGPCHRSEERSFQQLEPTCNIRRNRHDVDLPPSPHYALARRHGISLLETPWEMGWHRASKHDLRQLVRLCLDAGFLLPLKRSATCSKKPSS